MTNPCKQTFDKQSERLHRKLPAVYLFIHLFQGTALGLDESIKNNIIMSLMSWDFPTIVSIKQTKIIINEKESNLNIFDQFHLSQASRILIEENSILFKNLVV